MQSGTPSDEECVPLFIRTEQESGLHAVRPARLPKIEVRRAGPFGVERQKGFAVDEEFVETVRRHDPEVVIERHGLVEVVHRFETGPHEAVTAVTLDRRAERLVE